MPALLDAYGIPHVFSDPLTLALCLDKGWTKRIVRDAGVPTPGFRRRSSALPTSRRSTLPFPLFLKPVAEGSGKGVSARSRVNNAAELQIGRDRAARALPPAGAGRDLSARSRVHRRHHRHRRRGARARRDGDRPHRQSRRASITASRTRNAGTRTSSTAWSTMRRLAPRPTSRSRRGARLRCRDGGRIDIRCDAEGRPHFIEVNPLAGLNPEHSDLCFLARFTGTHLSGVDRSDHGFVLEAPSRTGKSPRRGLRWRRRPNGKTSGMHSCVS